LPGRSAHGSRSTGSCQWSSTCRCTLTACCLPRQRRRTRRLDRQRTLRCHSGAVSSDPRIAGGGGGNVLRAQSRAASCTRGAGPVPAMRHQRNSFSRGTTRTVADPGRALGVIAGGRDGPRVSGPAVGTRPRPPCPRRTDSAASVTTASPKRASTYALATHAPFARGRRRCLLAACLCSTPPPSGSAFATPA
jgi:hypothetical protein